MVAGLQLGPSRPVKLDVNGQNPQAILVAASSLCSSLLDSPCGLSVRQQVSADVKVILGNVLCHCQIIGHRLAFAFQTQRKGSGGKTYRTLSDAFRCNIYQ
jgi:hypothetical protein